MKHFFSSLLVSLLLTGLIGGSLWLFQQGTFFQEPINQIVLLCIALLLVAVWYLFAVSVWPRKSKDGQAPQPDAQPQEGLPQPPSCPGPEPKEGPAPQAEDHLPLQEDPLPGDASAPASSEVEPDMPPEHTPQPEQPEQPEPLPEPLENQPAGQPEPVTDQQSQEPEQVQDPAQQEAAQSAPDQTRQQTLERRQKDRERQQRAQERQQRLQQAAQEKQAQRVRRLEEETARQRQKLEQLKEQAAKKRADSDSKKNFWNNES